jgi:excisionase family DNA binding protein
VCRAADRARTGLATRRRAGRASAAGPGFLIELPRGRLAGEAVSVFRPGSTLGRGHSDQLIDDPTRPTPMAGEIWQRVSESRSRPALVRQLPLSGTAIAGFPAPSPRIVQPGDQVRPRPRLHLLTDVRIHRSCRAQAQRPRSVPLEQGIGPHSRPSPPRTRGTAAAFAGRDLRFSVVKFSDAELAEIRQLFRERVQSAPAVQRARIPRPRLQRPPALALRGEAVEPDKDAVLRPGDLAALLGVSPLTLGRWASDGFLPCLRTVGGQRRFRWAEVRARIANVNSGIRNAEALGQDPAC